MDLNDPLVGRVWVDEEVDAAARRHVQSLAGTLEAVGSAPLEESEKLRRFVQILGREGVLRIAAPAAWGGRFERRRATAVCLTRRTLARIDPLADFAFALQGLTAAPLMAFGGERFATHVERLLTGEAVGAYALTEERAGTDVSAMQCRAEEQPDGGWRISGHKRYVSNAGIADFYVLFAVTDPEAPPRERFSAFLVPADADGLHVEPLSVTSEHPVGALHLESVRLPPDARIGEAGRGLAIALSTIQGKRATVGAAAVGMAERALLETVRHVKQREQFGAPLSELQMVQGHLGTMYTELEAAWLLVLRAAALQDAGADRAVLTAAGSMAKLYATEAAFRIADQAVQLHGGSGLIERSVVARLYRRLRPLRIYEGTNDVQRLLVARELLRGLDAAPPT